MSDWELVSDIPELKNGDVIEFHFKTDLWDHDTVMMKIVEPNIGPIWWPKNSTIWTRVESETGFRTVRIVEEESG